jgi:hypothetical protein
VTRRDHVRQAITAGQRPSSTSGTPQVRGEPDHVQEVREEITAVLAPRGLRLSQDKTRVVDMREGFDFLGFHIK